MHHTERLAITHKLESKHKNHSRAMVTTRKSFLTGVIQTNSSKANEILRSCSNSPTEEINKNDSYAKHIINHPD